MILLILERMTASQVSPEPTCGFPSDRRSSMFIMISSITTTRLISIYTYVYIHTCMHACMHACIYWSSYIIRQLYMYYTHPNITDNITRHNHNNYEHNVKTVNEHIKHVNNYHRASNAQRAVRDRNTQERQRSREEDSKRNA